MRPSSYTWIIGLIAVLIVFPAWKNDLYYLLHRFFWALAEYFAPNVEYSKLYKYLREQRAQDEKSNK